MRVSPVFQNIYMLGQSSEDKVSVLGAEALTRINNAKAFTRPLDVPWSVVDYTMLSTLASNMRKVPTQQQLLFVNVSEQSLNDDVAFESWLEAATHLTQSLWHKHMVQMAVEISELTGNHTLNKRWDALKNSGMLVALDDFGTEQADQVRLASFPWDFCKFDMCAVTENALTLALKFCEFNGVTTIAEKIETQQESREAHDRGMDIQQGYYFCRPEPYKPSILRNHPKVTRKPFAINRTPTANQQLMANFKERRAHNSRPPSSSAIKNM